jgi:lipopolysaccharide heptosyltransferase II
MFEEQWQQARNILCIRLDALGDVLMTTPALRALKESGAGGRRITLLTSSAGAEIATLIPEVDKTITYDPPWMKAAPHVNHDDPEHLVRKLVYSKFDAAVIFTVFSQNPLPAALLAYMAGIPLRLAYCRENPYQLLTNWEREVDDFHRSDLRHEVQRQLDLVASVGSTTEDVHLSLYSDPVVEERVLDKLRNTGLDVERPWLILHPGATAPSRRYPPEHFAKAAARLISEFGFQVLLTGNESERDLVERIRSDIGHASLSLVADLNLQAFTSLIHLAPLLISNNSGPVHMAAALGTPVVDLYALTNPQHTPWMVPHRVLYHDVPCRNCYKSICPLGHHNCLRLVSPDDVVSAAVSVFIESRLFNKPPNEARVGHELRLGEPFDYRERVGGLKQ